MNESKANVVGCCIIDGSRTKVALIRKITVLKNKNGIRSRTVFFFKKEVYDIVCNLSIGLVKENRNPEMKKNKGMWKL